jgi:hypothetical protein
MSLKTELVFQSALLSTSLVQPVNAKSRGKTLEVLCRQMPGQERPWLALVQEMLVVADAMSFNLHVCRRYVLKDGELAYGWNLGVDAPNPKKLAEAVDCLVKVLAKAKPVLQSAATQEPHRFVPRPTLVPDRPKFGQKQQAAPQNNTARLPHNRGPNRGKVTGRPTPRPPGEEAPIDEAPPGFSPRITTIKEEIDSDGRKTVIQEMPLPHVYREMNVPSKPGGRGAKLLGNSK